MKNDILAAAALLSNVDLLARLQQLAGRGRETTVEMVAHLAELEQRRSYLAEGYGSLFDYCRLALRLSEHAAYNRVGAARIVRRFPAILAGLADGGLNLTTVRLVAPHLTPDNYRDVLTRAAGMSKRETEVLIATLAPQPDVPPSVRKLPAGRSRTPGIPPESAPLFVEAKPPADLDSPATFPLMGRRTLDGTQLHERTQSLEEEHAAARESQIPPAASRPIVAPLSPGRFRVQFTMDSEAHENLRWLQDLLRRDITDGDPGAIFARALKLLVAQVAKEKTAATPTPGPGRPPVPGSRHIPAPVKRAVWLRDRGQCNFVAPHGRRCIQRAFLEFHHIQPFAIGGEATVTNISLRCRRHNVHEAELLFGTIGTPRARNERPGADTQDHSDDRGACGRPA